jgi:hypothetical protein
VRLISPKSCTISSIFHNAVDDILIFQYSYRTKVFDQLLLNQNAKFNINLLAGINQCSTLSNGKAIIISLLLKKGANVDQKCDDENISP